MLKCTKLPVASSSAMIMLNCAYLKMAGSYIAFAEFSAFPLNISIKRSPIMALSFSFAAFGN